MTRALFAACVAGILATSALAQTAPSGAPDTGRSPDAATPVLPKPGHVLSEGEIKAKLQEEGYTEVTELQLQGPSYEAKALKDGRKYNLTVDARTGNIRSRY